MIPFFLAAVLAASEASSAFTPPQADYVAHEWGTFTSVQGADGAQLEWNPFVPAELPTFVYTPFTAARFNPGVPLGKGDLYAKQRMETPVIYFYSDKPQDVDVDVSLRNGSFTEWFPLASVRNPLILLPSTVAKSGSGMGATMKWAGVKILPGNGASEAKSFPTEARSSHYYPARETDAAALRIKRSDGKEETEKFLFYRGVAQFDAPLRVTQVGDNAEAIRLENQGADPLGAFFIYSVRNGKAAFKQLDGLGAKSGNVEVQFDFSALAHPVAETRTELAKEMRKALADAGLYEREAAAMVKTWDESWFGEEGTRVLYLLPQKWSDSILPLTFSPVPKEVKRVFVGRAEMITPAQESAVLTEVTRYASGDLADRNAAVEAIARLKLGRFAPAIGQRIIAQRPKSDDFAKAVWDLINSTRPVIAPATAAR